jgi:hypothetical protein
VNGITATGRGPAEDVPEMAIQPRPSRGAPGSALRSTPPAAGPRAAPVPAQGLQILVAGVDKDERGAVEAAVRRGLGSWAASGPWSVSVVQLAGRWSVTVDGGGFRSASAMADRGSLAEAIHALVGADREGTGRPEARADAPPTEARDRHSCERCGQGLLVVYESQPDEPKELAPVACPHCWAISHVEVGAWAAAGREYRSEKA